MRIVVDAVAARSGGGVVRLRELASTFPRLRPEHDFLFVVRSEFRDGVEAEGIRTLCPPPSFDRPPQRVLWEHLRMPHRVSAWKPDAAFSPFNVIPAGAWPSQTRLAVIISNLAPYAPALRTMYAGRERLRLGTLKLLTDRSIAAASVVFLLSRYARDLIGSELLAGKAVPLPMAPPPVDQVSDRLPREDRIVIVGDLLRYKGIETVIDALERMPSSDRPRVVVLGRALDGPYVRRIHRRVRAAGLDGWVEFKGRVGHGTVTSFLSTSMACLAPSRFENGARVLVEAMSLGCPVVASDIPAFREACGEAATYFRVGDGVDLAARLGHLIADADSRDSLARAGQARMSMMSPSSASQVVLEELERSVT